MSSGRLPFLMTQAVSGLKSIQSGMTPSAAGLTMGISRQKCSHGQKVAVDEADLTEEELSAKPFSEMPGPRSFPIIGTLWQYFPGGPMYGIPWYDKLDNLQRRFGDVVHEEIRPGLHMIHLYNPRDFETVYRNEGKYPKRESFHMLHRFNDKYNEGVHGMLTSHGENWKRKRSLIQVRLSRPSSVRTYLEAQSEVADDFVKYIKHKRDKDNIISNLTPDLYRFATESIGVVCFNKRVGALGYERIKGGEADNFIDSVNKVMTATQSDMTCLPLYKLYNTATFKKLIAGQSFINKISMKFTLEAMENKREMVNLQHEKSIIKHLTSKSPLSLREVSTLIGEYFFGGVDTTGHLLAFTLYNLCKNPDKMETLREEIENTVGISGEVTSTHVDHNMPYLKAVLKETLRLTPVSPGNLRTVPNDSVIAGYHIPAQSMVILHNEWAGKQTEYVPNQDRFLPERWLRNDKYRPIHPYILLPFGYGPRSCPGRRLSEQETSLAVIKILQNFDIEYCYHEDLKYEMRIVNTPVTPLMIRFTDRSPH